MLWVPITEMSPYMVSANFDLDYSKQKLHELKFHKSNLQGGREKLRENDLYGYYKKEKRSKFKCPLQEHGLLYKTEFDILRKLAPRYSL